MTASLLWPSYDNPPEPCAIKVIDAGTGWHCTTHNVTRDDYIEGQEFRIGGFVNDLVTHVAEATTVGAIQSLLLDINKNVLGEIAQIDEDRR